MNNKADLIALKTKKKRRKLLAGATTTPVKQGKNREIFTVKQWNNNGRNSL